jgi:hypothetical protein
MAILEQFDANAPNAASKANGRAGIFSMRNCADAEFEISA